MLLLFVPCVLEIALFLLGPLYVVFWGSEARRRVVVAALGALDHKDRAVPAVQVKLLVGIVVVNPDLLLDLLLD